MTYWCAQAFVDGQFAAGVRVGVGSDGRVTGLRTGTVRSSDDVEMGVVVPGFANAHSHLFHRVLRGRTHADGGDFWQWRREMYRVAAQLDPDRYRRLAIAVFAEMVAAGYTAVGEFHYVHHQRDGEPYPHHEMELALADAADEVGIRLTVLDTCYLTGGLGVPLTQEQRRFGDGSAVGWLDRWYRLRDALRARPSHLVTLGAAIHSVRAVPAEEIRALVAGLPVDVALHIHLSEQPKENADCLAAYGVTPTGLLDRLGVLGPRLTVIHATHLRATDVVALANARVTAAFCPTTEADLGDGIGPGRALTDGGVRVCIGSDQNAVVDPWLELRGLEAGERLASGRRGVFSPADLWAAGSSHGYHALGHHREERRTSAVGLAVGRFADFVEIDPRSTRTAGSRRTQLVMSATAADVQRIVVGGRIVTPDDPAGLLEAALRDLDATAWRLG